MINYNIFRFYIIHFVRQQLRVTSNEGFSLSCTLFYSGAFRELSFWYTSRQTASYI